MAVPLSAGDAEARERLEIDLLLEAARCASVSSRCCARIPPSASGTPAARRARRSTRWRSRCARRVCWSAPASTRRTSTDQARIDCTLAEGVVFAQHNLVTDGSFNEFHMIVCRNVMIYFGFDLQESVLRLFDKSMSRFGILALGRKESIRRSAEAQLYEPVDEAERIFRRRR